MLLDFLKSSGRSIVLPAVLALAGVSAGCVLSASLHGHVYAEEFEVIPDEGTTENPDALVMPDTDAGASGSQDLLGIEGLIEVVEEHSNASGAVGQGSASGKKGRKLIVGFKDKGCISSIHFEMGQKPSLDKLVSRFPTQLDIYFQEEKKSQTVSVSWKSYSDDYSSTDLNYYFFTPVVDSDKYAMQELNLQTDMPYIEVIRDAVSYEMIESAPPKVNESAVFKYCTQVLRFNKAAACGVLANIYCESGFRTNAIGDGGTSVGICQWHNGRWTNLRAYVPDDWQTLEGQLRFMRKELFNGYKDTLKYLHSVSDDAQGAYDAAYYWCMHYEMPDKTVSRSITRGYLAKNVYWDRYKDIGPDPDEEELAEAQGESVQTDGEGPGETHGESVQTDEESAEEDLESEGADVQPQADDPDKGRIEEQSEDPSVLYRCVSDDGLRVRSEASTDSEMIGLLAFNEEVAVSGTKDDWAVVSVDGQKGYCLMEFLVKSDG